VQNRNSDDSISKSFRDVAPYMGLGFQLGATIVVMFLVGDWIDGKYDTKPTWTLVLGSFGIFTGMYHFIKTVMNLQKKEGKENDGK